MIKIFIDQGHNPVNPNAGAEAFGFREQDINYEIGVLLANLLNNDPNFSARLSRNYPTEQLGTNAASSLAARVNAANNWRANYFLSLHCNASNIPSASGSECYVYAWNSPEYWMAERILIGLNNSTGLPNRGIFVTDRFYVLRRTTMPAILVEMGFITNSQDVDLLVNHPDLFAQGIYNGILEYFGF